MTRPRPGLRRKYRMDKPACARGEWGKRCMMDVSARFERVAPEPGRVLPLIEAARRSINDATGQPLTTLRVLLSLSMRHSSADAAPATTRKPGKEFTTKNTRHRSKTITSSQ